MNNRFSAISNFEEELDFEEPTAPPTVDAEKATIAPEDIPEEVKNKEPVSVHDLEAEGISPSRQKILDAKIKLHRQMLDEFNLVALEELPRDQLVREIHKFVSDYVAKERLALNNAELEEFVGTIVDEFDRPRSA